MISLYEFSSSRQKQASGVARQSLLVELNCCLRCCVELNGLIHEFDSGAVLVNKESFLFALKNALHRKAIID